MKKSTKKEAPKKAQSNDVYTVTARILGKNFSAQGSSVSEALRLVKVGVA